MLSIFKIFAAGCLPDSKFGIPTWYKYLQGEVNANTGQCEIAVDFSYDTVEKFAAIGLAVIEILLFVAGVVAVGFLIYGGFQYMTSQGEPDRTKTAKDTVLNAIIGLVIAIMATTIVRFVGSRL